MPDAEGRWDFHTSSNARSLDGLAGAFTCTEPAAGHHGPGRVDNTLPLRHADGTPLHPARHHRVRLDAPGRRAARSRRCATLAGVAVQQDPDVRLPEVLPVQRERAASSTRSRGRSTAGFDFARFDPAFFRHLERRIARARRARDRGRPDPLPRLRPLGLRRRSARRPTTATSATSCARLAAFRERLVVAGQRVRPDVGEGRRGLGAARRRSSAEDDPHGHLRLDPQLHGRSTTTTRPWVTHASIQRVDVYRTAENTDAWRERWGKPVVIDECAYEGDIDQGWGNITGRGDGAPLLGGRGARRLRRPRRDLPTPTTRCSGGPRAAC